MCDQEKLVNCNTQVIYDRIDRAVNWKNTLFENELYVRQTLEQNENFIKDLEENLYNIRKCQANNPMVHNLDNFYELEKTHLRQRAEDAYATLSNISEVINNYEKRETKLKEGYEILKITMNKAEQVNNYRLNKKDLLAKMKEVEQQVEYSLLQSSSKIQGCKKHLEVLKEESNVWKCQLSKKEQVVNDIHCQNEILKLDNSKIKESLDQIDNLKLSIQNVIKADQNNAEVLLEKSKNQKQQDIEEMYSINCKILEKRNMCDEMKIRKHALMDEKHQLVMRKNFNTFKSNECTNTTLKKHINEIKENLFAQEETRLQLKNKLEGLYRNEVQVAIKDLSNQNIEMDTLIGENCPEVPSLEEKFMMISQEFNILQSERTEKLLIDKEHNETKEALIHNTTELEQTLLDMQSDDKKLQEQVTELQKSVQILQMKYKGIEDDIEKENTDVQKLTMQLKIANNQAEFNKRKAPPIPNTPKKSTIIKKNGSTRIRHRYSDSSIDSYFD